MEGTHLPFYVNQTNDGTPIDGVWKVVRDGSLRNGAEYVLNAPIPLNTVMAALEMMEQHFKAHGTKPHYSFRTSTHLHINLQNATYEQLLAVIFTYLCLENVMVNSCAEHRRANRFCLRVSDAEGLLDTVHKLIRYRRLGGAGFYGCLNQGMLKYAAMNLYTLRKYGSLEFRSLEGTADWEKISNWATAHINIRDAGMRYGTIEKVWERLNEIGAQSFMQEVLGDMFETFYYEGCEHHILESTSLMYDLVLTAEQVKQAQEEPENAGQPPYPERNVGESFGEWLMRLHVYKEELTTYVRAGNLLYGKVPDEFRRYLIPVANPIPEFWPDEIPAPAEPEDEEDDE
ncbi:MAG: hypothetical protein [Podoviridae sp. ctbj_2]|nr:MAG: hypothetical protein [Podoviridae sp. ctbj_2]